MKTLTWVLVIGGFCGGVAALWVKEPVLAAGALMTSIVGMCLSRIYFPIPDRSC